MFLKYFNIASLVFCLFSSSICSYISQGNQFFQREIQVEDTSPAVLSFKNNKLYVNLDYIEFVDNEMFLQINEGEYLPITSISHDSEGCYVTYRPVLDSSIDLPKYFHCPIPNCSRWVITSHYRFRPPTCPDHGVPMI